jgi:dTDP-4-amino-4,6-dideoxygalactose transaminase
MHKVPFVGYKIQYQNLKDEIDKAMQDVLLRGDLILRKDTEEFERRLAEFIGVKYAIGLNSGTDALFFSLKIAGIGGALSGSDEVITVSHTFVASISTIVQAGAKPILVDVGDDYLINAEEIEKVITKNTKAIISVHLNGRMCDMDKIMEMAKKHNLIVIEDSAQSLGASYNGKRAGSIGLTGCFSFYPAKILGCFGDGGALVTNNPDVAEKAKLLRDHGQKTKTDIVCFGWNSRLDNLQAAVLNIRLNYLDKYIERRRQIAEIYNQKLSGIKGIKLPPPPVSENKFFDVFQNYVIRAEKRDELFIFLKDKGVETLIKDPIPNHMHKNLNLSNFSLPMTEQLSMDVISLPMYPELTDEQVNYAIDCIKEFYNI